MIVKSISRGYLRLAYTNPKPYEFIFWDAPRRLSLAFNYRADRASKFIANNTRQTLGPILYVEATLTPANTFPLSKVKQQMYSFIDHYTNSPTLTTRPTLSLEMEEFWRVQRSKRPSFLKNTHPRSGC